MLDTKQPNYSSYMFANKNQNAITSYSEPCDGLTMRIIETLTYCYTVKMHICFCMSFNENLVHGKESNLKKVKTIN